MSTKKRKKKIITSSCVKTMLHRTDFSCLVLDLLEGRRNSDVNKSNKSFVIWPEVKINGVFFTLEIFSFIKL